MGVVRGQCEGQGWFVRAYKPGGDLRWKYVTPGWANCTLAEFPTDIAARGSLVVVSGFSHGCCGDQFHDGWITAFKPNLVRRFRANTEPPSTPLGWFDTAWGVDIASSGTIFVSGWAATASIPREMSPTPGTPFLEKLDPHGTQGLEQAREGLDADDVPAGGARTEREPRGDRGRRRRQGCDLGIRSDDGLGGELHADG
jgi:hypothetical protein